MVTEGIKEQYSEYINGQNLMTYDRIKRNFM